jgi:choline dehydrogenase-like flavoprotein
LSAAEQQAYDAIVVGSGMTGGWAAKELTEAGLRTLVLERGRQVEHVKDYPTAGSTRGSCRTATCRRSRTSRTTRSRSSSPSCSART